MASFAPRVLLMSAIMAATALVSQAQASVFVIGGGLATECSMAALKGLSDDRSLALCDTALDTENLNRDALAGTLVNRGVIYMRRQDFAAARRDLDRAVVVGPTLGEAFVNRGAAMIGQRDYAQALSNIDRGLGLSPQEPEKAYFNRALAYEGLGDMKRAYFDYLKASELKPDWEAPKTQLVRFTVTRPGS